VGYAAGRGGRCHHGWRWAAVGLAVSQLLFLGASFSWFSDGTSMPTPVREPAGNIPADPSSEEPRYGIQRGMLGARIPDLDDAVLPGIALDSDSATTDEPTLTAGKIPEILIQFQ
jgi:hypothetical protein